MAFLKCAIIVLWIALLSGIFTFCMYMITKTIDRTKKEQK